MATWQLLLLLWAAGIPAGVVLFALACPRITCRLRARRARAAAPNLRTAPPLLLAGPSGPLAALSRVRK